MLFPKQEEYRSAKLVKSLSAVHHHSPTEVKHTRNHQLICLHNLGDASFEKKKN